MHHKLVKLNFISQFGANVKDMNKFLHKDDICIKIFKFKF